MDEADEMSKKGGAFFKTKTFLWAVIKRYTRKAQEKSRRTERDG